MFLPRHSPVAPQKFIPSTLRRSICFTSPLKQSQDSSSNNVNSDRHQVNQVDSPGSGLVRPAASHPSQHIKTPFTSNPNQASQSSFTSPQPFDNPQRNQTGRGYRPHEHSSAPPRVNLSSNFAKHGPTQGYPPPRQGYPHPRQDYPHPPQRYPHPPQRYPHPPQRYPLPSQGYTHPPQSYSHPPQSFPHPARDTGHDPPRWMGQGNHGAQWQFPRRNNYDSNYSQPFQYQRGPSRAPHQPQATDSHGSAQTYPNPIPHSKPAPHGMYGPTQPPNQAFPGPSTVPFSVAEGQTRSPWLAPDSYNPVFGTPPPTRPSGPHGAPSANNADSNLSGSSLESALAARRQSAPSSSQSFSFDMSDVSGLHTLDQFVGKQSRPSASQLPSPREPQPIQPSRHASWNPGFPQYPPHQYSGFHPPGFNQGLRPGFMAPTPSPVGRPPVGTPTREGLGRPSNPGRFGVQGGMTGAQVGARRGAGRERGRENALGLQRGRGRGTLFNKFAEPSLPPPPQSVLNEKGEFGKDPRPSGCPHGMAALSEGIQVDGKVGSDLGQATDHKTISSLLLSSSTPVELPGFEKPIQMSPMLTEPSKPNYEIESGGTAVLDQKKRGDVVGRARNLVSQNSSMDLNQKRQAIAVVDFLLLSRQERMQRVV